MPRETSYGIIPLRKQTGEWKVLLVQHKKGAFWAFPKGHPEPNETPLEAAVRELFEETGLKIKHLLRETPFQEVYTFARGEQLIQKQVFYFLAEVEGQVTLQPSEIYDSRWVKVAEAATFITFPESQRICNEVAALNNLE